MNLPRLLLERFRWFDDSLRTRLADRGLAELTTAESMVFPYLDEDGTRPSELARRLGITRQSAQALIRGLERKGLVELIDDPQDGRSKTVLLTEEGERTVPVALDTYAQLEAELVGHIGIASVTQLRQILQMDWDGPPQVPTDRPSSDGTT